MLPSSSTPRRAALLAGAFLCVALLLSGSAAVAGDGSSSITLTRGVTYRARLKLSFFECLAAKSRIRQELARRGFAEVRVFTSSRELPADWPAQFRRKAGSCERYAEGVWVRPTTPRRRPSSIDSWWVAHVPAGPPAG